MIIVACTAMSGMMTTCIAGASAGCMKADSTSTCMRCGTLHLPPCVQHSKDTSLQGAHREEEQDGSAHSRRVSRLHKGGQHGQRLPDAHTRPVGDGARQAGPLRVLWLLGGFLEQLLPQLPACIACTCRQAFCMR